MRTNVRSIMFKIALTVIFICVFYIQKERDITLMEREDNMRFVEEFEAREDALEEKLKPLIERNKLIDCDANLSTENVD